MNDIDVGDIGRLVTTWPFKGVCVTIFNISNLSLTQTVLKIRTKLSLLVTSRLEQYRWRMLETIDVGYMFAMIPQPTSWNGHHHEVTNITVANFSTIKSVWWWQGFDVGVKISILVTKGPNEIPYHIFEGFSSAYFVLNINYGHQAVG